MEAPPGRAKDSLEVTQCFSVSTGLGTKFPGSKPSALPGIPLPAKIQTDSRLLVLAPGTASPRAGSLPRSLLREGLGPCHLPSDCGL